MSAAHKVVPMKAQQAKLVVMRGRGNVGKSTVARVLLHRAAEAGRPVVIADADRSMPSAPTLPRFFDNTNFVGDVTEAAMFDWYRDLTDQQAEAGATVLMDTQGGDRSWAEFAEEVGLEELLGGLEVPIRLVQVLVLGPDVSETSIFKERHGVKGGPNLVIVLNEGIGLGRSFDADRKNALYQAAISAGSHEVVLPRLRCLDDINKEDLTFKAALGKLLFTDRGLLTAWLRRVEERLRPVADLLP